MITVKTGMNKNDSNSARPGNILPYLLLCICLFVIGCSTKDSQYDAFGTFETDEVIVSSQANGQLLSFHLNEGDSLTQGQLVGRIDSVQLVLQKAQVQATIQSLPEKTTNVQPDIRLLEDQLAVQETQLATATREQKRAVELLKADAITSKYVDEMNDQVAVLQKQIQVTKQQIAVKRNTVGTQNRSIMSDEEKLKKQVAQMDDQISKSNVINPIRGTVLTKYAQQGEITSIGKPLYKIADLSFLNLRSYITGSQLSQIKLNQKVKVLADDGVKNYRSYEGVITWISGKAEFTPKTIQTKEERADLVYAIKIKVKNDGYLKIGMYGEVLFNN